MSLTKTLVGELLNSLKNDDGEDKITAIIKRLETLEENAKKNIIEEDVLQRAEKYNSINYNIHLKNTRYKMKPLSIMVEPYKYKTILVPVEQYICCSAADQDDSNCCNNPCNSCPYAKGIIPKTRKDSDATMVVDLDPSNEPVQESEPITIDLDRSITETVKNLVIGSSAPINVNKKPCPGCNCDHKKNITLDIEDIVK